ncbi:MAG: HAD-IA family hydrolase [Mariprofundus sp.]|nr:HAD-IA family hydrolase [Mariprofundus sp.]
MILFDCDGTLTDSHGIIVSAMQQAFASCNFPAPSGPDVNGVIGLSLRRAVQALLGDAHQEDVLLLEQVMQSYRQHYLALEHQVRLFPDVRETLELLRARGYWLGVVTGKSHPGLVRVLETFELADFFLVLRTADCTHSKPHPAMVLESMQELGVNAHQTCVVGDTVLDAQMAGSAGVRFFGVSYGVATDDELRREGAQRVLNDFTELLAHFPPL